MAHLHEVIDTDKHFIIDAETMDFSTECKKLKLNQGDHNCERYTFEMPRYIDKHDMSLCDTVEIHTNNIDSSTRKESKDIYKVDDFQVVTDERTGEERVAFTWLVNGNCTVYAGKLNFRIRFACLTDSTIDYQKWTNVCSILSVSDGFSNTEQIVQQYADVIEKIRVDLEELAASGGGNSGTVVSENAGYAEVGEWSDGNPNGEDRVGYFVCHDMDVMGINMRKVTSKDDVRGVTVTAPAFSGNCSTDKFDESGNLIPKYSYVTVMGIVPVIDDGSCVVGGRCMPNDDGTASAVDGDYGYLVMERIDESHVMIALEPGTDYQYHVQNEIDNKLDDSKLSDAVNTALAKAKESGEFDGADGNTPFIGENGNWWIGDTDTGVSASGGNIENQLQLISATQVTDDVLTFEFTELEQYSEFLIFANANYGNVSSAIINLQYREYGAQETDKTRKINFYKVGVGNESSACNIHMQKIYDNLYRIRMNDTTNTPFEPNNTGGSSFITEIKMIKPYSISVVFDSAPTNCTIYFFAR